MTNDNEESPFMGTTELPPIMKLAPDFGEPDQIFNMRDWLKKPLRHKERKWLVVA